MTATTAHRGQVRIAYLLADAYQSKLLHVHGLGWHYWDGQQWVPDATGHATRAVLDILRQALADSLDDKNLREDVRKSESAAGIKGVLAIAAALAPFAADLDKLPPEALTPAVARVTSIQTSKQGIRSITVHCPYCGRKHIHGWPINESGQPGPRVSHCRTNTRTYTIEVSTTP